MYLCLNNFNNVLYSLVLNIEIFVLNYSDSVPEYLNFSVNEKSIKNNLNYANI